MDFFSPFVGLMTVVIPSAIDAVDYLAETFPTASAVVEQRVSVPAHLPNVDDLLALPSGFRAPGYGALTISRRSS